MSSNQVKPIEKRNEDIEDKISLSSVKSRETWGNSLDFFFSALGYAGNLKKRILKYFL